MRRVWRPVLAVTGALALAIGAVVYDERGASRACDDFIAAIYPAPNVNVSPVLVSTEWKWRTLEWECVYTRTRTGRVEHVDIDEARSRW